MSLYFAYGSNMDAAQMRERCPGARLVGAAELPGYRLAFTIYSKKRESGCADIVPAPRASVYGLLYEMTPSDFARLDRYEGVPDHYRRLGVTLPGHATVETYEVVEKIAEGFLPTKAYMRLLCDAATLHAFPEGYRALLSSIATKD